jgi:hypothetical protein
MNSFRAALTVLQTQIDELDRLKGEYYEQVLAHEEEVWDSVLGKVGDLRSLLLLELTRTSTQVSLAARTSLDVYDRIAAKSYGFLIHSFPILNANRYLTTFQTVPIQSSNPSSKQYRTHSIPTALQKPKITYSASYLLSQS